MKLTRAQQQELIASLNKGEIISVVGDRFGLSAATVHHYREKWTSIPAKRCGAPSGQHQSTTSLQTRCRSLRKEGASMAMIASIIGLTRQRVWQLLK